MEQDAQKDAQKAVRENLSGLSKLPHLLSFHLSTSSRILGCYYPQGQRCMSSCVAARCSGSCPWRCMSARSRPAHVLEVPRDALWDSRSQLSGHTMATQLAPAIGLATACKPMPLQCTIHSCERAASTRTFMSDKQARVCNVCYKETR